MNSFINNSDIDSEKIKFKERFSFGLGDYGTNLTYTLMVTFLAYFYTEVVGVSAILVGSLMFFARVIDGILCVFVGIKIDKTNTKYGKAMGSIYSYSFWIICIFNVNNSRSE